MQKSVFGALVAVGVALAVIAFGLTATSFQIYTMNRAESKASARQAVAQIDGLIDEAKMTTAEAKKMLGRTCTSTLRQELNRLTIIHPHIRVLSLIVNDRLSCTSYGELPEYKIDTKRYVNGILQLKRDSVISPGSLTLIYLNRYNEGMISASIDMYYISEVIKFLGKERVMIFSVGNEHVFSKPDENNVNNEYEFKMASQKYPYYISILESHFISPETLFREGWVLLLLFFMIAGLSAIGAYKYFCINSSYEQKLARAIRFNEIIPWYQPVINGRTGEVAGVEVLARWKDRKTGQFIPPDIFIAIAEQSNMIIPLTKSILQQVYLDLGPLVSRFKNTFHIGVNIDAAHFESVGFVADCYNFTKRFKSGNIQFVIEITERQPFERIESIRRIADDLLENGVVIALDDFGTGYSNLEYLNRLPISFIKIDRSFINKVTNVGSDTRLVDCIIDIAKSQGMRVIAEGVENRVQVNYLKSKGVDFFQGYYFSRPLPAKEFLKLTLLQGGKFDI